MTRLPSAILGAIRAAFRSRAGLLIENLALRQQLTVLKAERPRPKLTPLDRAFWVLLRRASPHSSEALISSSPRPWSAGTVPGFGCTGGGSRGTRSQGDHEIDSEVRRLIRRMASENPTWGAPRIHSELRKLGLVVSERTVARYMPKRPAGLDALKRWMTFPGELDWIGLDDAARPGGAVDQIALFHELDWLPFNGVNVRLRYDFFDPDLSVARDHQQRLNQQVDFAPLRHTEIQLVFRQTFSPTGGTIADFLTIGRIWL